MSIYNIQVLYRHRSFVICDKPVGIPSQSPGLPDLVSHELGTRCYPVHRLDQGTGGVIVLALDSRSCSALQKSFSESTTVKHYLAVIEGKPADQYGEYMDLLFHDVRKNKSFVVNRPRKGVREASCSWKVLESTDSEQNSLTLVMITLTTGRTHQIRVQFASRGLPLVGDRKYGSRISADTYALWSAGIRFPDPMTENRKMVEAFSYPPCIYPWNLFHIHDQRPDSG